MQGDTKFKSEVMGCQGRGIEKAIRPVFADRITFCTLL